MVIFAVDPSLGSAADFMAALQQAGVLTLSISNAKIRAVTHLDVNSDQVRKAGEVIQRCAEQLSAAARR
jgi:threonine aldolase